MGTPPKETVTNNELIRANEKLDKLVEKIEQGFLAIQRVEAEKVPVMTNAYTVLVNIQAATGSPFANQPKMFLPKNANRREVSIMNLGPSTLMFHKEWFDPVAIEQQFSDPANPSPVPPVANQVVKIGYLPANSAVTWSSTSPLWMFNISTTQGALIAMYETVFTNQDIDKSLMPPGVDGMIGQGYDLMMDDMGDNHLVKGLR